MRTFTSPEWWHAHLHAPGIYYSIVQVATTDPHGQLEAVPILQMSGSPHP